MTDYNMIDGTEIAHIQAYSGRTSQPLKHTQIDSLLTHSISTQVVSFTPGSTPSRPQHSLTACIRGHR